MANKKKAETKNVKYKTGKQMKEEIIELLKKQATTCYNSPDKFDKLKVGGLSLALQLISKVDIVKE